MHKDRRLIGHLAVNHVDDNGPLALESEPFRMRLLGTGQIPPSAVVVMLAHLVHNVAAASVFPALAARRRHPASYIRCLGRLGDLR